jgi:non-ribosomal peptide synthetase component E (peptide arylation enzyme)
MPNEQTGEAVCAYIVPQGPGAPDVAALAEHLSAKGLARQKLPERVVVTKELPRNLQGKVRKDLLRADAKQTVSAGAPGGHGRRAPEYLENNNG